MHTSINAGESVSLMELFKSMDMLSSASNSSPRKSALGAAKKDELSRSSLGGFKLLKTPKYSSDADELSCALGRRGGGERRLSSLERKLGALTKTIKAQREKEELLLQRMEELKETEKMIGAANAARILQLKRELSMARSSLTKQSSKQQIARRNSYCVVTSLKENLCDVPNDKEELEAESVWEVNTKVSMIRSMRRELQENKDAVRTTRNFGLKSNERRTETCEEIMHHSYTLQMLMEELIKRIKGEKSIRNMGDASRRHADTQYFMKDLLKTHRTLSCLSKSKTSAIRNLTRAIAKCGRLSMMDALSVPPAIPSQQSCHYQCANSRTDDVGLSRRPLEVFEVSISKHLEHISEIQRSELPNFVFSTRDLEEIILF